MVYSLFLIILGFSLNIFSAAEHHLEIVDKFTHNLKQELSYRNLGSRYGAFSTALKKIDRSQLPKKDILTLFREMADRAKGVYCHCEEPTERLTEEELKQRDDIQKVIYDHVVVHFSSQFSELNELGFFGQEMKQVFATEQNKVSHNLAYYLRGIGAPNRDAKAFLNIYMNEKKAIMRDMSVYAFEMGIKHMESEK